MRPCPGPRPALVDRSKSIVVKDVKVFTLLPILHENIAKETTLYTDEARLVQETVRQLRRT